MQYQASTCFVLHMSKYNEWEKMQNLKYQHKHPSTWKLRDLSLTHRIIWKLTFFLARNAHETSLECNLMWVFFFKFKRKSRNHNDKLSIISQFFHSAGEFNKGSQAVLVTGGEGVYAIEL